MESESFFNSPRSPAVRLEGLLHMRTLLQIGLPASAFGGAMFFAAFGAGFFGGLLNDALNAKLLGVALLSSSLFLFLRILGGFFSYLKERNEGMSFEAEVALTASLRGFAGAEETPSSALLLKLLREPFVREFILPRALLNARELRGLLRKGSAKDPSVREIAEKARERSASRGSDTVEVADLFSVLASHNPVLRESLVQADLSVDDIKKIFSWGERLSSRLSERARFWTRANLRKRGSIATDWSFGFSPLLDRFSLDLTHMARSRRFPALVGHGAEMDAIERALSRREQRNALVVGERGSGQRRMLQELATRSLTGEIAPELRFKRVLSLDVSRLLASIQDSEAREAALSRAFSEAATAGNVILAINDLHNFVSLPGEEARPGTIDISTILAPYLELPQFLFVGLTSYAGLHRYLEQVPGFVERFSKIEVAEISAPEALVVLEDLVPSLERSRRMFIPYAALRSVVELSEQYVQAVPFPQKAISLLDDALVSVDRGSERVLLPRHVSRVLTEQTQIPIGDVAGLEREKLLNLEDLIHKRLIDQEEAVSEVASALRRARSEVGTRKGPMGSFLFLGPTGVGKTETAKALAAIYFGSESRMIRLDMSEFQNLSDMGRLLGSERAPGLLTTPVRENPFSLVLLDELEKAHPNIVNLLLQVLDEGHVTDGLGRKVSFRHTVIIATSNAGYQLILDAIKTGKDFGALKEDVLNFVFSEGIFRPELINRFDAFALYKPLSREDLTAIAGLMFSKLRKNLQERGVELAVTDELKARIANLGYDPKFGARNMRRVLQDRVENPLAAALLRGDIKRGDSIAMDPETFEIRPSN